MFILLFDLFSLPMKWSQIQTNKEQVRLNFLHLTALSAQIQRADVLVHDKISESLNDMQILFNRLISNQPFHHWRLPPLFHLHPDSSGGKTKQNI